MTLYIQLILATLVSATAVHGYHILCYQPIPSKSHDLLTRGIVNPLLRAGHKITWVTPFPAGKPENVTIIDVSQTIAIAKALNLANRKISGFEIAKHFANNITKAVFNEGFQKALQENQYDAVISEWFFSDVEAGLAAVQNVPWIVLSGFPMHRHLESLVDSVKSIFSVSALGNNYPMPLNFWDRVKTTLTHLSITFDDWMNYSIDAAVYESFFKPIADARQVALPPYSEAIRNIAVLFVNSHPSFTPAHSLPPNVVEIGGYHIDETIPPLPKDIQDILDSSPQGVVYFSMGTLMRVASLPERMKKEFIEILGSIPYTVLWKFEEKLENLPKNIHIRAWMPQASILAHPNVKVFISHCGLLSNLETLHYGVPMLALPAFGDQPTNAEKAVWSGYAVMVAFGPDMMAEFRSGLKEILSNDKYYKKAKYISTLFRQRPVAPSTLIRHYVELAIESKGAHHLRSSTLNYSWYQICMLDQAASLFLVLTVIYLAIRKLFSMFRKNNLDVKKSHKVKKIN